VTRYNGVYKKQPSLVNGKDWWKHLYTGDIILITPLKDVKLRARFSNSQDFWKILRAREIFRYWDLENNKSPPQAEFFWGYFKAKTRILFKISASGELQKMIILKARKHFGTKK